jgi:hypothetical protein
VCEALDTSLLGNVDAALVEATSNGEVETADGHRQEQAHRGKRYNNNNHQDMQVRHWSVAIS